ncbi:hypothetical protein [Streptomyces sp. NPDC057781]
MYRTVAVPITTWSSTGSSTWCHRAVSENGLVTIYIYDAEGELLGNGEF